MWRGISHKNNNSLLTDNLITSKWEESLVAKTKAIIMKEYPDDIVTVVVERLKSNYNAPKVSVFDLPSYEEYAASADIEDRALINRSK